MHCIEQCVDIGAFSIKTKLHGDTNVHSVAVLPPIYLPKCTGSTLSAKARTGDPACDVNVVRH